jgi:hypothetical protein
MLKELLDSTLDDGLPIPRDLLNEGLHAALCLNRPEAAEMLLSAGADTSIYKSTGSDIVVAGVAPAPLYRPLNPEYAWMQLLQAAKEDVAAPYLASLIPLKEIKEDGEEGVRGAVWWACGAIVGTTKLAASDGVSVDAVLFMLLLLANRPGLARLMWLRDVQEREDHALHSALVACGVCRGLTKLSEARGRFHTLEMLRQVKTWAWCIDIGKWGY